MPSRARIPIAGLVMAISLSGCILFPPWIFGGDPGSGPAIVVENATDENWVLSLAGDLPAAFAISAGETGTIQPWGSSTTELVLTDPECAEADRLSWDGSAAGVRIANGGTLEAVEEPEGEPSTIFVEFWDCLEDFGPGGLGGAPEPEVPLPDAGGSILVVSDSLAPFLLDVATGTIEPLEYGPTDELAEMDAEHTWSPDGSQVAFSRASEGSDLYLADGSGGEAELLVEDASGPRWSPDGTRIAYVSADPFAGGATLMVIDLESGESTELAPEASIAAWSPDGALLAFVTSPEADFSEGLPTGELRLVKADGSGLRTLADAVPFGAAPAWSPDGERIAFTAPPEGFDPNAFDFSSDGAVHDLGRNETTIVATVDGGTVGQPAWSPDGQTLAFALQTVGFLSGSAGVGLVPAGGGEMTRIAEGDNSYLTNPIWSPDGEWLAFVRQGEVEFSGSLVAIRTDGSDETVLATGVMEAPTWLPDTR